MMNSQKKEKNTIVLTICFVYNCHKSKNKCSKRKDCSPMNKRQELIERIDKLTPEQFELLIALYSQQEKEFVQASQFEHPSFLEPSA